MLFRREQRTQQYFWKIFSLLPAPLSQTLCRIDAETFCSSLLALRRFRCRFCLLGGDNAQPASRNGGHKIGIFVMMTPQARNSGKKPGDTPMPYHYHRSKLGITHYTI